MKNDFWMGLAVGVVITFGSILLLTQYVDSPKQKDCQLNLPRTEVCKLVWVPEKDLTESQK